MRGTCNECVHRATIEGRAMLRTLAQRRSLTGRERRVVSHPRFCELKSVQRQNLQSAVKGTWRISLGRYAHWKNHSIFTCHATDTAQSDLSSSGAVSFTDATRSDVSENISDNVSASLDDEEEYEYEYVVEEVEVEVDENGREIGIVGDVKVDKPDAIAVNDADIFREQSEERVRKAKKSLLIDLQTFGGDVKTLVGSTVRGQFTKDLMPTSTMGKLSIAIPAAVILGSFLSACYTVLQRYNTPWSKRKRTVNKNRIVVDELSKLLPEHRHELNMQKIQELRKKTGFSTQLLFRKYLRYWLDQRNLDQESVNDILYLKDTCKLTEDAVIATVGENIQRAYKRTGIVMKDAAVNSMTSDGMKKKMAGKDNLGKLLYLIESSGLVNSLDKVNELRDQLVEASGVSVVDLSKYRMSLES